MTDQKQQYILHLADNALILGQRIAEWCGHGPVLEQDIALTNMSLDLIGQARLYFQYLAELKGGLITEDDLAYLRMEHEYMNCLLVEQPNGDFGKTITRQFFYDVFHFLQLDLLTKSNDEHLAAIAVKSIKEVKYHLSYSSKWIVRLGDGTPESHQRIQQSVDTLWKYTGELFEWTEYEQAAIATGLLPDPQKMKGQWTQKVKQVLDEATLEKPDIPYMQSGGKQGRHTEHMGYILTELQYMQRAYPGLEW